MIDKLTLKKILESRFSKDLHKNISEIPRPKNLKDNLKAAKRIKKAIECGEKILIVGDYDVDGIISCVLMDEFLNTTRANFKIVIPNRFKHGYGLNKSIIEENSDANLIVTVDNGINALESATICKNLGIDLIITDHHCVGENLPDAYAIINPKQIDCSFPDVEICGAQVAWYLIGAIKEVMGLNFDMASLLDILMIAIIADMMELRDLNRILLKSGIKRLNSSKRVFLKAIREFYFKKEFEFEDISFLIAPLINSSGRMKDARVSFDFLRSKDIREANRYLEEISQINELRKEEERRIFLDSLEILDNSDDIIVVWKEDWHEGVVGIVASRLSRHFKKPSIVFSLKDDVAKGSARSVGKIDILELIKTQKDLIINYGGHKGAAGLVIKKQNLNKFKDGINENFKKLKLSKFDCLDEVIGELKFSEIDKELLEILEYFEPYGNKNPKPTFLIKDLEIMSLKVIGKDQNHLKLMLQKNGILKEALFFNFNKELKIKDHISIIAHISKNSFKGIISPEILIQEIL